MRVASGSALAPACWGALRWACACQKIGRPGPAPGGGDIALPGRASAFGQPAPEPLDAPSARASSGTGRV